MQRQPRESRLDAWRARKARPALLREPESDELGDDETWIALQEF